MLQINHRNFFNSSTCVLNTQLCPQVTLGSRELLKCHKYSIHTYDYKRLNYGKDMHIRAYCYVICNCQSKPSVHTQLNEYVKALSSKLPQLIIWWQCLSWLGPPLPCGVLSVPYLINLFLPQIRPWILLCGLTKYPGSQGSVLFDPPQCSNRTHIYMATLVYD